jgi:hypothetical protein
MLPTVTIESTRVISMFDKEMLVGSLIVIAVVAWMMLMHVRHDRHR